MTWIWAVLAASAMAGLVLGTAPARRLQQEVTPDEPGQQSGSSGRGIRAGLGGDEASAQREDVARETVARLAALLRAGAPPPAAFRSLAASLGRISAVPEDGEPGRQGRPARIGTRGRLEGRAKSDRARAEQEDVWRQLSALGANCLAAGEAVPPIPTHEPGAAAPPRSWAGVAWCCSMSATTGAPLAPLLEQLARDCGARADAIRAKIAGQASAKSTRRILAWLPLGGILLAQLLGADPLGVLVTTMPGRICALLGGGLWLAALLWSRRILNAGGS